MGLHLENQVSQNTSEIKKLKVSEKNNDDKAAAAKSVGVRNFIDEFYGDTKVSITESKPSRDSQNCRTSDPSNNRLIDRLNFERDKFKGAANSFNQFERPLPIDSKAD